MFDKINFNYYQFGQGRVSAVAYDTAWVARVPDFPELNHPAFPKALAWLRQNQCSDGSWGNERPFDIQGKLLSTLIAILALVQWQQKQDEPRIKKGIASLSRLIQLIDKKLPSNVGFELILPALVKECQTCNLKIPPALEKLAVYCHRVSQKKQEYIMQHSYSEPGSWWFSLEMLGPEVLKNKNLDFPLHESSLFPHGSIAASPSATAYFLSALRYRGKNSQKAYLYLQAAQDKTGGVPHVFPIDEFELSFSANYLMDAGVSLANQNLNFLIKSLRQKWSARKAEGLGYSSDFFIDPDDSAVGFHVLMKSGLDFLKVPEILKVATGTHIENYAGEDLPSISANLHALDASNVMPKSAETSDRINKLLSWIKTQQSRSGYFRDKWHTSPIYPTMRAIVSMADLDKKTVQRCIVWLTTQQNKEGGWGVHNFSTAEETALASIALVNSYKKGYAINLLSLQKAYNYFKKLKNIASQNLWIGKVWYCPTLVVNAMVLAANYALQQVLEENFLNISSLQKSQHTLQVLENTKLWAFNYNILRNAERFFSSGVIECGCNALTNSSINNLQIYSQFGLLILVIDDLLDEDWHHYLQQPLLLIKSLSNLSKAWSSTKLGSIDADDPFKNISLALQNLQPKLLRKKVNMQYFNRAMKLWFQFLIKEFQFRCKAKKLTLKKYINLRIIAGGMDVANELAFLLEKINLSERERHNKYFLQLKKLAYQALIISNDLLSLQKEKDEQNNYFLIKLRDTGIKVENFLQEGIKDYNQKILEYIKIKDEFLNKYNGSNKKNLQRALTIIENQVQAHLTWALQTNRYGWGESVNSSF